MKKKQDPYPELEQFIGAYFHEDFDLFGNTIEEIALCYKSVASEERINQACFEMDRFLVDNNADAESAFAQRWGSFNPALWGHTVASFFEELNRILRN